MALMPTVAGTRSCGAGANPRAAHRRARGPVLPRGRRARVWIVALLVFAGCSPADGDGTPPAVESAVEGGAEGREPDRAAPAPDTASRVGAAGTGGGQARGREDPTAGAAGGEEAPERVCLPPRGPLAGDASLEGRAGRYHLTMVEQVGGNPARTVEGSLTLLAQVESLRRFAGSAGGTIPGVTSPLFGSTDVNLAGVGAVQVGSLSSADPDAPGALVIESETGGSPSILLRLGSDANRRNLVRFDGGYAVLDVVDISEGSFGGTWSSGARGPESQGYFCATLIG